MANDDPLAQHNKPKKKTTEKVSGLGLVGFVSVLEEVQVGETSVVLIAVLVGLALRWGVSLWGFSGQSNPPMHGDFEAQRHWLEITTHLNPSDWYRYDLQYWGLDYPPLTAYHSWLLGFIANKINPEWVALDASRGYESSDLKLFMRYTALITDLLIHFSAVIAFHKTYRKTHPWVEKNVVLFVALIQPGLILIDHGHFQYNSAMLGFALWSVMALYYSLPFFFYLLGVSVGVAKRDGIANGFMQLTKIGAAVIVTFGLLFAPFLTSLDDLSQVIVRIFPVGRGLYEDKVANFWCAISVVVKVKKLFPVETVVKLSIIATLTAVLPTSLNLFVAQLKPFDSNPKRLLLTLLNGSLAFFLFSFQVHEKSILIPLMPATMLLSDSDGLAWEGSVFITTAMFSMYPLLRRDGLAIPTVSLTILFNLLFGYNALFGKTARAGLIVQFLVVVSYLTMAGLMFSEEFVNAIPFPRYPDLYAVINSFLSCVVFVLLYLRYSFVQFFGEYGASVASSGRDKKKKE
ncbi:UNVERIFIED_CONTAM: Glucosyltransferase-like protein [Siphonaria sp. JEL0065]|nr:Glucosyltransferase-like protein [Siphonaria sp. JEL0065]